MTTFNIDYWDDVDKVQKQRSMTVEEETQRQIDIDLATVPIVPQKVTRRQARQALLLGGYLDQVPTMINTHIADETQRALAMIEWEDSLEFERSRPLVASIGATLGMNSAQLDELFILAGSL